MNKTTKLWYAWLITCLFAFIAAQTFWITKIFNYPGVLGLSVLWLAWHSISCYTFYLWFKSKGGKL